ncbi:hypothetical protein [Anaerobacillus alkalilacustris]|nr:hypothetical protein [Anaerobacillus alkalilacustris]
MKLSDHLSNEQRDQMNSMRKSKPKPQQPKPKKKKEKVNWADLMGMNRDRFCRGKGGAMRRK